LTLIDAKARLPHGQWYDWLAAEFDMSRQTADNFIHVAERFGGKSLTISDISPKVLYLLAAPSTPDEVVEDVMNGHIPANTEAIKAAKDEAKKARDEADQFEEQLQQARTAIREAEHQRVVALGEANVLRGHLDLLRKELDPA
jgi:septal ring factor EnvC (AmiA/AmiB activator)